MTALPLLSFLAALAAGGPEVRLVKVESLPLMVPAGKSAESALPEARARELEDIWVELQGVRMPDGTISLRCSGGNSTLVHDFRRGLPK